MSLIQTPDAPAQPQRAGVRAVRVPHVWSAHWIAVRADVITRATVESVQRRTGQPVVHSLHRCCAHSERTSESLTSQTTTPPEFFLLSHNSCTGWLPGTTRQRHSRGHFH